MTYLGQGPHSLDREKLAGLPLASVMGGKPLIRQAEVCNRLLRAVPPDVFAQFAPSLRPVDLRLYATVQHAGELIDAVFFLETGYASLLVRFADGYGAEVGMIGREGMVGSTLILGESRAPIETMIQSEGHAYRLDAVVFRRMLESSKPFRDVMMAFTASLAFQVAMAAACNARHSLDQRFARWLLMAHDRASGDTFPMTHEFLSMMLGVRRAGISVAAGMLQKAGRIRYEQGSITVIDRIGLEGAACECYSIVQRECTSA